MLNLIGLVAYLFICLFYPQTIYRIIREKSVGGYSLSGLWTLEIGLVLAQIPMTYQSIATGIWTITFGNALCVFCSTWILLLYYRYKE